MRRFFRYAPLLVFFFTAQAFAERHREADPIDAVFTASQVVIVVPDGPQKFKIERSYLGDLAVGSRIELPTFKPLTFDDSLDDFGDPQPLPMTADTRILLFLQPDANHPGTLEVADNGSGFFVRDLAKIDELEAKAKGALPARKKWQEARDLADPGDRIRALFPYLHDSSRSCRELTLEELAKLNPASGDYLASLITSASPADCLKLLLLDSYRLRTPKSHAAAIAAVNDARLRFEKYLLARNLKSLDVKANWNEVPAEVKTDYEIVYHGLADVSSFDDKTDAPFFRNLVPFLLANGFRQPIEVCVYAMDVRPSTDNMPVLVSIWRDYKAHDRPPDDESRLPSEIAHALAFQDDFDGIPTLLETLDYPKAHDDALSSLSHLTGKRFRTADEWKSWYAALHLPPLPADLVP